MPTDVVMPQMGESIFEGTITKWLKKAGDAVQKDEPLFEISTDKVDAEIPSPVAGVLTEIKVSEGDTVQINTVVAVVAESGSDAPAKTAEPVRATPEPVKTASAAKSQTAPQSAQSSSSQSSAGGGRPVVMPQMGESIFEGTITKWLKKAGDAVEKDEPLFEISTDKVDAEIPSPIAGVLTEIKVGEGETVQINTVVATIGGSAVAQESDSSAGPAPVAQPDGTTANPNVKEAPPAPEPHGDTTASLPEQGLDQAAEPSRGSEPVRSSPLVRRMAKEHHVDLRRLTGSGSAGRITKDDMLQYLAKGADSSAVSIDPAAAAASGQHRISGAPASPQVVPMSRMRSIIAQRMLESKLTSPHAYSVYKVDMTRVVQLRERMKAGFELRNKVKLTYMPFIAAAAVRALEKFPVVNASLENGSIHYHPNIHLGIAVALEWGLIVPVVRDAEQRNFKQMSAAIADLAERARAKKLKPDEASGSTFTLTNSGIFGGEFGTPIINQPESAILAIGGLKKEPVVVTDRDGNDSIAIRSMQSYCLGFDHRIIDGADAGRFMTEFKLALETWDVEIG